MRLPVQTAIVCECGRSCGWNGRSINRCPRQRHIVINQYGRRERLQDQYGKTIVEEGEDDETDVDLT